MPESHYKCDISSGNCYHVVIVGGGPAAIAAAIYLHRFDMKVVMIGTEYGGAIARTYLIENYPGFFNVSGFELMESFQKHYEYFKIPFVYETVTKVEKDSQLGFKTITSDGVEYRSCTVLIASGARYRKLNVPGEDELRGRGVSYCATCDGAFFRDKKIAVIGGSDSAAVEALFLSRFGKEVSIIYRKEKIRAEPINIHRCEGDPKIKIVNNTKVTKIIGKDHVEAIELNGSTIEPVDGVFIEIGADPNVEMLQGLPIKLNEKKEIIANAVAETNIPGLFAAGDVTNIREKQVITACGQAVSASYSIRDYMENNFCVD